MVGKAIPFYRYVFVPTCYALMVFTLEGFMMGTLNYDKDGVSALGVFYEMAAYLHREGKQLHQQLNILYDKYVWAGRKYRLYLTIYNITSH